MNDAERDAKREEFDARMFLPNILTEKASELILGDKKSGFSKFGIVAVPDGDIIVAIEVRYYTEYPDIPIKLY